MKRSLAAAAAVLLAAAGSSAGGDWPQFRGPHRDGVYPRRATVPDFPEGGPPVVWERPVGAGFSGPAAARGRVILFHRLGGSEVVESIDAASGETVWKSAAATTYKDDFGFDEGPRATPVVAGGQIYTFSAQGVLRCLEFAGGRTVWSLDTRREFDAPKGFFGAASTPLALGSRLFANVGGSGGIIAVDKDTGRLLWQSAGREASYSSPVAADFEGETLVVFFTGEGLAALDPSSGAVRFERRWRSRSRASVNAAAPIVSDGTIFLSASYCTGAVALRARAAAASRNSGRAGTRSTATTRPPFWPAAYSTDSTVARNTARVSARSNWRAARFSGRRKDTGRARPHGSATACCSCANRESSTCSRFRRKRFA